MQQGKNIKNSRWTWLCFSKGKKAKNKKSKDIGIIYWYNYEEELGDPYYLSIRLAAEKNVMKIILIWWS